MTDVGVSSTTISFCISCHPECLQSWRFAADISLANQKVTRCHVSSPERRVRCSGLRPASNYTVRGYFIINQKRYPMKESIIRTEPARCKKPGAAGLSTTPEYGESYIMEESIEVRCDPGYRPAHNNINCVQEGDGAKWHPQPQCIEKCKGPGAYKEYSLTGNRAFYDPMEEVTVRCKDAAYRAEPERIQCVQKPEKGDGKDEWSASPQCIALCRRPQVMNSDPLSSYNPYYSKGEKLSIKCKAGYYPSPATLGCVNRGTPSDVWDATVTCRGVTVMVDEVSSSSVSLLFSCLPDCLQSWRFHVRYSSATPRLYTWCAASAGRRVTCSGLQPASNYTIQGGILINERWYTVRTATIRTKESAPDRPEITKLPTLTDPVIKWSLSNSRGAITGYQMNLSAWRDYDPSFSEADSRWFPANVTEYKIPLQYGTNYTITLRGFTAAGAGEITSEKIETEIGGVTMMVDEVSSSSVSLLFSCHPECPQSWRFHVEYSSATPTGYTRCDSSAGRRVTCSGLQPASNYNIMGGITINGRYHSVTTATIRTKESGPKITKHPTISDPIMKWNLSDSKEAITGFQMNLSAWRDYDPSFSEADSRWFLAFVTEYILPLKYGTSYTISLRGFTAAGAGEITSENIETEIGDPPPHMENTLHDQTVQLHPLHNPHGPISSYEVIVFSSQEENLTSDCLRLRNVVYNSSLSPDHYTAALLTAKNLTASRPFTLGDNQYYNGFHNAPLTPGHNYTVYIRVTSSWRRIKKSSCAFAGFLTALTADRAALPFMVVLLLSSFVLIILYLVPTVLALLAKAFTPSCKNSSTTRSQRRTEGAENNDDRDYENLQEDESKL